MSKTVSFLLVFTWVLFAAAGCAPTEKPMLDDVTTSRYQVGQVWTYRTRPGEEDSRLTILKVEKLKGEGQPKVIVHVHVDGLSLVGPGGKPAPVIGHMPFTESALDGSVVELVEEQASLPDFQEGYRMWLESFEKGGGPPFDRTVAETIDAVESLIPK